MEQFINKYSQQISFSLSCYDRLVITGNLPEISYADGMTSYLNSKGIRIFDYAHFAEGHREKIRQQIDSIVKETGVEVQYLKKSGIRKESFVSDILENRGANTGVVCILSTLESCNTYKPWHDKRTGKTFLKSDISKCFTTTFKLSFYSQKQDSPVRDRILVKTEISTINNVPSGTQYTETNISSLTERRMLAADAFSPIYGLPMDAAC